MRSRARPRVLLLAAPLPPPYGGIARYIERAVQHLANRGYAVHVIEPPRPVGTEPSLTVQDGWDIVVETEQPLNFARALGFVLRNLPSVLPLLLRYVPALLRLPRFAGGEIRAMVASCAAAERVIRRTSVDVVHAFNYPWKQGAAAWWAGRRWGIPSVLSTFGEVLPHRSELRQIDEVSRPFRSIAGFVVSRVDVATSMTEHCRQQVRHLGLEPARVRMLRLVVGMEPFDSVGEQREARRGENNGGAPRLLFVGQVRQRKGPETLIRAMPHVLARHPRARLAVVGPDHDGHTRELERLAVDLGVGHAVDFIGPVSDEALPEYYAASDLFLFPTLTPIECLGLTFVQAMFAGTLVIATRIAGAPEIVTDGIDGFLVPPGEPLAFAERIIHILDLPAERREEIVRAGRERVRSRFAEEAVLDELVEVYRGLGVGGTRTTA